MNTSKFLLAGFFAGAITGSFCVQAEALNEVISKAIAEHPQAQASLNKVQAQEKTIKAAKADYWPTLDVVVGGGKQRKNQQSSGADGEILTSKEASVSVKQNLFSGFNTMSSVKVARQKTKAEQWRLQSTLEALSLEIVDVYLKVFERRDLVDLAEKNLSVHDDIYQQIEQRTRQGLARSSDLAQIEGRRARANANLVNSKNNLMDAESEYQALTGSMPGQLQQPDTYKLTLPESIERALELAREHNPGLKAAAFDIRSSQSQYSSSKSSFFPSLDLEFDNNWRENSDGQPGRVRDTKAMLRVRYNLFRGGGDRARLQESAYRVEESRAQKEDADRNMEERLRLAWAAYELVGQQKEFLELHEKSSQETVVAYREQFNIGKRTLLDLLDGENELFQSSQSLSSATYQEAFARYRILGVTGQLLKTLDIPTPESMQFSK